MLKRVFDDEINELMSVIGWYFNVYEYIGMLVLQEGPRYIWKLKS